MLEAGADFDDEGFACRCMGFLELGLEGIAGNDERPEAGRRTAFPLKTPSSPAVCESSAGVETR